MAGYRLEPLCVFSPPHPSSVPGVGLSCSRPLLPPRQHVLWDEVSGSLQGGGAVELASEGEGAPPGARPPMTAVFCYFFGAGQVFLSFAKTTTSANF